MKQRRLPRRMLPGIRAQFVRMLEDDVAAKAIMSALRLSRSTYFQWKKLFLSRGVEGLKVRPLPGGVPKLTDRQTSRLFGWIAGSDPRQFQFDFALWTRKIVRDLVKNMFDVEMTPQGIGALLRRIGLSPQRPLYRAYQQDPEAVRRWKEEEFPAIRAQARELGAEVYFGDESGVRSDHHAGTTWAPVGQTPVVEVTGERNGVNMISAVSPGGSLKFEVFFGNCNSTVFVEFLKKLMHDAPGPVFLVLDNVSFHKTPMVKNWRRLARGKTDAVLPAQLLTRAQPRRVGVEERQARRHQARRRPARVRAVRDRHPGAGAPAETPREGPGILP